MLGLLGIAPLLVLGIVSLAVSILGTGGGLYYQHHQAKKAEDKNDKEMAKQERRAKVMHLKQFNQELATYNRGTMAAKKQLLNAEREQPNFGSPATRPV